MINIQFVRVIVREEPHWQGASNIESCKIVQREIYVMRQKSVSVCNFSSSFFFLSFFHFFCLAIALYYTLCLDL